MSNERDNKDIALIKQDINYIKEDMGEVKESLKVLLEGYMPREEVESKLGRNQKEMERRISGVYAQMEKKADKTDVEKINANLSRVVWVIILAFLASLLSLIII